MASNTTQLDEDMCVEILKRLPVKTLGRFRCVCKWWNSLISSSFFINHRLSFTTSSSDDSNKSYLLLQILEYDSFYSFNNPQDPHLGEHLKFLLVPFIALPVRDQIETLEAVDVVHGIVCLSRQQGLKSSDVTILWNPTIHKYVKIPLPPFQGPCVVGNSLVVGFGFDGRKNDFKVVRTLTSEDEHEDDETTLSFEVFSTQEGRWRRVAADHIDPCFLYSNYGRFKDGAIHWLATRRTDLKGQSENEDDEYVLLMFDCEREEFKTMELPRELSTESVWKFLFIACCTGMLSVFALTLTEQGNIEGFVWVMEEYGVASSWRKLACDQGDFVKITTSGVFPFMVGMRQNRMDMGKRIHGMIKRSHQPINCHVFEPSMFFMDGKSQALSYTVERDEDGVIYYIKDGKPCDYIPLP